MWWFHSVWQLLLGKLLLGKLLLGKLRTSQLLLDELLLVGHLPSELAPRRPARLSICHRSPLIIILRPWQQQVSSIVHVLLQEVRRRRTGRGCRTARPGRRQLSRRSLGTPGCVSVASPATGHAPYDAGRRHAACACPEKIFDLRSTSQRPSTT